MTEDTNIMPSETEEGEKLFTRKELESIVEYRLSRDRKNTESLNKIRGLVSGLRKNDVFKNLSNAQMAGKLAMIAEQMESNGVDEKEIPEAFSKDGTKIPDAEDAVTPTGEKEATENTQKTVESELQRFLERFDSERLFEVLGDGAFRTFLRGRRGDLLNIYEDYLGFLSEMGKASEEKRRRDAQRQLCSTGFSEGASCATDYGSMLSENQRRIAKAAGMSYRQYSELLCQIPSKKL